MPRRKDTAAAFKHFYADAVIFYSCHFEAAPPTFRMKWDGMVWYGMGTDGMGW